MIARFVAIVPPLLGITPEPQQQAVLDVIPGCPRNSSWWNEKRDLYNLLRKFRACEATDERDRIFALLGMSTDAYNTPFLQANYEKYSSEVVRNTISFLLSPLSLGEDGTFPNWGIQELLQKLDSLANELFILAAKEGKQAILELLAERKDFDVNWRDEYSRTPLWSAASSGCTAIVQRVIDLGADVNAKDSMMGETVLHKAAVAGNSAIL